MQKKRVSSLLDALVQCRSLVGESDCRVWALSRDGKVSVSSFFSSLSHRESSNKQWDFL